MHRLNSRSTLRRIRLAVWVLLIRQLLTIASISLVVVATFHRDYPLALAAVSIGGLVIFLTILGRIMAQRTKCPLCMVPVLGASSCAKHRKAQKLLGSYRLRVAMTSLFLCYFACPYCQEMTAMEVRTPRR